MAALPIARPGEPESLLSRVAQWAQTDSRPLSALDALRSGLAPRPVRRIDRWFAPRQFLVRSAGRTLMLQVSRRLQVAVAGLCAAMLAGFLGTAAVAAWHQLEADRMVLEMENLRATALSETVRAAEVSDLLGRLEPELSRSIAEREKAAAAAFLAGRTLAGMRGDVARLIVEHAGLAAERDKATVERDAALTANRQMVAQLDVQTRTVIGQVESIIAAAGVDRGRAVRTASLEDRATARGGPFIPWRDHAIPGKAADVARIDGVVSNIARLQELRGFLGQIPLGSPLPQLEISAGFGFRIDPFSRYAAAHEGLDLAGAADSNVLASTGGTVIFAGWRGEYGNLVEVDHGLGLLTRYAHLSRIAVKPGDTVARQ